MITVGLPGAAIHCTVHTLCTVVTSSSLIMSNNLIMIKKAKDKGRPLNFYFEGRPGTDVPFVPW